MEEVRANVISLQLYFFSLSHSLSILLPFSTFFKWQNFGAAAAEKFKVAKRQNSFQSDALVLLSLSLMYLVIAKVVGAISKCVLVVESLNELKVQVTLVSVHFICNKIYSIKKLHIEGLKSMI